MQIYSEEPRYYIANLDTKATKTTEVSLVLQQDDKKVEVYLKTNDRIDYKSFKIYSEHLNHKVMPLVLEDDCFTSGDAESIEAFKEVYDVVKNIYEQTKDAVKTKHDAVVRTILCLLS